MLDTVFILLSLIGDCETSYELNASFREGRTLFESASLGLVDRGANPEQNEHLPISFYVVA